MFCAVDGEKFYSQTLKCKGFSCRIEIVEQLDSQSDHPWVEEIMVTGWVMLLHENAHHVCLKLASDQ
jgi:hypothetical protein